MKTILKQLGIDESANFNSHIPKGLSELLQSGIHYQDDCYTLKRNLITSKEVTIKDFSDLTGYECYINRINIDDYLDSTDLKELLLSSFSTITQLEGMLSKFKQAFAIILSLEVDDIISASVRFHKIRATEFWLDQDLESYQDEALFIKET